MYPGWLKDNTLKQAIKVLLNNNHFYVPTVIHANF